MSPSPRPLEFFCNRSLGRQQVPDALRAVGWSVHTMAEGYGEAAAQQLHDVQLLADVGARGWVVLHKDTAIARRHHGQPGHELAALIQAQVRAFWLLRGQLTGAEQAASFLRTQAAIEHIVLAQPGPYGYGLYANGLRPVWP